MRPIGVDRAFCHSPKTHRILDVPCGGGKGCVDLAQQGYQITGADYSEAMVAIARRASTDLGLGFRVDQQDIEALTCASGEFDAVIRFRLFHHFPTAQIRQRVVAELCQFERVEQISTRSAACPSLSYPPAV